LEFIQKAIDQLTHYDLQVSMLDTSGKINRVPVVGDKGKKKSGWYVAHEFSLNDGRVVVVGRFGNWKMSDQPQSFEADFSFSEQDKIAYKKKMTQYQANVEEEKQKAYADAVEKSGKLFSVLADTGNTEYLKRKQVRGYGVRYGNGDILFVPVEQFKRGLVGFQIIYPNGDKRFLTGTEKCGGFHLIGADKKSDVLLIAEGYATAATLFRATGYPCFVAFDTGNLLSVAKMINQRWPDKMIVFCADDDHETKGNPGISKALAAANAVNGMMIKPTFLDKSKRTDFNDMHVEQGLDAVKKAVNKQILEKNTVSDLPNPADVNDVVINPVTDFSLPQLLHDFVVLHGQGSGVFDLKHNEFMAVSDLRNSIGNKIANEFLNSEYRKVVLRRNVVFDPTTLNLPPAYINLYRGLPLKPKKGDCQLLLDVLFYLCEGNPDVYYWLLKWIAFPLQNVGAKMTTAVVIHGPEGAGKNLFWTAIQRIYGDYTSIITQTDLESSFNGWASKKLFVIGNEVVSRQEMFHKKGVMKNMISEPEWFINEKNISPRRENNHANFVFFSNFLQPVTPDKDDRRYLILWTPPKKEKEYYKRVAQERDNGGTEALYHYLMQISLGDFDEYTEPLMTEAKEDLIQLSMKSDQRFIDAWLLDDLPVPVCPVLTTNLYDAYKFWCKREGEKFYVSSTEFGTLLNKHELVDKQSQQRYLNHSTDSRGTFAVPFGLQQPDQITKYKWLSESTVQFSMHYKNWIENNA
jgi:putative DNA primase/helicase